ncbi:hypothetical protein [Natronomonas marina]|uniref:hypothetical protein n=1 Tax=Natronomonas marina TaxID=2961939 RepID=UPI0020C9B6EF|nr:hypothetical protein [Natronomonas marina]
MNESERMATTGEETVTIELPRGDAQTVHGMLMAEENTAETADEKAAYARIKARVTHALETEGGR